MANTALEISKKMGELDLQFDKYEQAFLTASPYKLDMDRFKTIALQSIAKNDKLLQCSIRSLMLAIMDAAQYGLVPDSLTKEGYLIPFKGSATFIPGYMGAVTLATRSGYLADLDVHKVFEKDVFTYHYGMNPDLTHIPCRDEDRGEFVACYVVFEKKDGKKKFTVLEVHDGVAHKNKFALAKNKAGEIFGPWVDHFESQCMKTVILNGLKYVPKSAKIDALITKDENLEAGILDQDDGFIDLEPATQPNFNQEEAATTEITKVPTDLPKSKATPPAKGDAVGDPPKLVDDLISKAEVDELNNLVTGFGLKDEMENILQRFNIKSVEGLPKDKYMTVTNELLDRGAAQ